MRKMGEGVRLLAILLMMHTSIMLFWGLPTLTSFGPAVTRMVPAHPTPRHCLNPMGQLMGS